MDAGGHRNDGGERRHEVRFKVVSDHQVRFAEIELGGDEKELLIPTGRPEANSADERTKNDRAAKRAPRGTGELTLEDLNFWEEKAQADQVTGDGTANAPDWAEDTGKPSVGAYRNDGERATVRTDAAESEPMIGAPHAADLFDAAHSIAVTNTAEETLPSPASADPSSDDFHEFGEGDDQRREPGSSGSSLPPSRVTSYDGVRYYSREQQFVLRARELAWHVEPEAPFVPFKSYWPTYDHMSSAQVKWYFYWREEVRSGRYPDTDLSYLFLYVYELINGIGWTYPEQGWQLMNGVRNAYRERYSKIDAYMREWLFDFFARPWAGQAGCRNLCQNSPEPFQ
ncbi:TerB N-terminal domain-containing protein [Paenibacillus sp. DMB20]|uniref:TerB N-terminal domain-containing protein n=1 Tax=Paenibacillus sp. DMB20 TaxID=1642570 RepID=UPI00069C0670|nr:TerB N-terminal domain-containing protein [Paenibacillus sp. DMB20]